MADLTCIHATAGLCPACQEAFDEDLDGFLAYGDHPAGIAAWRELQEEMAREMAQQADAEAAMEREYEDMMMRQEPSEPKPWDDIPF